MLPLLLAGSASREEAAASEAADAEAADDRCSPSGNWPLARLGGAVVIVCPLGLYSGRRSWMEG